MKGLWKQSGLAAMACADVGRLNQLGAAAGRSRRRARVVVYGLAVAFAAFTAYIAYSSAPAAGGAGSGGGASWFGGVYASTAPYRSQISSLFSSIFPTNSSTPSPEPPRRGGGAAVGPGGGSSKGSDEVSRYGSNSQAGSGVGSSNSSTAGSSKQLVGSGGGAPTPSNNAGGGSAPPAGNSAGTGTTAAKGGGGGGETGGGTPANNPSTSAGAPNSAVDRNKGSNVSSSSGQAGGGVESSTSSIAGSGTLTKAGEKRVDKSNKQQASGAPAAAGNGSTVKANTKDAIEVPSNNIGSNNQAASGNGAPRSDSAAGNNTMAKGDGKNAVGIMSKPSSGSAGGGTGTKAKADLNNASNARAGNGSGLSEDATHKSTTVATPADNGDGRVEHNKASGNVASTGNQTGSLVISAEKEGGSSAKKQSPVASPTVKNQDQTTSGVASSGSGGAANKQEASPPGNTGSSKDHSAQTIASKAGNYSEVLVKGNGSSTKQAAGGGGNKKVDWIKEMTSCDMFHGSWVRDDSYPLYPEGSCPNIDEPFDCYHNGRQDRAYQKLRWKPSGCNIPRLNPTDMLERLRGKRLVFVGDSLNRNMWESLVCILRNSVKDKRKVFEASGRHEFKTEGSYSFLFTDYNCSVEFFRSPFLVQEWEMRVNNGKKKETLRLDLIEQSSPKYKDADFIIFNTGHWWTHEKTSLGKDYYQEGSHVYGELNVVDAFHKALVTWSRWIDANVNPKKTTVLFRGYSASHFSGGQWNSGGSCDKETEPIKNEQYLSTYPPKMSILEDVIHKMKNPVVYLNITRMTDYRKDAHPSIYRKRNLTEEERRSPERYQDCSHWCLPGVPDSWNELLYAQVLLRQHQMRQQ